MNSSDIIVREDFYYEPDDFDKAEAVLTAACKICGHHNGHHKLRCYRSNVEWNELVALSSLDSKENFGIYYYRFGNTYYKVWIPYKDYMIYHKSATFQPVTGTSGIMRKDRDILIVDSIEEFKEERIKQLARDDERRDVGEEQSDL